MLCPVSACTRRWHRAQQTQVILCSHNTDNACTAIYVPTWTKCVILVKRWLAPWWWFPCKPKHVGATFLILICFNKLYMCISWTIKGLIHNFVYKRKFNTHTLTPHSSVHAPTNGAVFIEKIRVRTAKILQAFSYFRSRICYLKNTETWRIWPFGMTFWNKEIRTSVTMCALKTFLQTQMTPKNWNR